MVSAMGGPQSRHYFKFLDYCSQAYMALRKNAVLLLNLLQLMVDSGTLPFTRNDLFKVQDRFLLDTSDEEAERLLQGLLNNSVKGLDYVWAEVLDTFHNLAN